MQIAHPIWSVLLALPSLLPFLLFLPRPPFPSPTSFSFPDLLFLFGSHPPLLELLLKVRLGQLDPSIFVHMGANKVLSHLASPGFVRLVE